MIMPEAIEKVAHSALPVALTKLRQLVGINSFTENAEGISKNIELLRAYFKPLGFKAEIIDSLLINRGPHLFLTRPAQGSGPTLCLVSHLDTVYPPDEEETNNFCWRDGGARIFGPGTVDIKGGSMLVWLLLHTLSQAAPRVLNHFNWLFALNSCEEDDSEEFAALVRTRLRGKNTLACLVFEAGWIDDTHLELVVSRKGRITLRVSVLGQAAHSGSKHHDGASAIRELARLVERLEQMSNPAKELTVNVGRIQGGGSVNRVPHAAELEMEIRCPNPDTLEATARRVEALSGPGSVENVQGHATGIKVVRLNSSPALPRNSGTDSLFDVFRHAAYQINPKWHIVASHRGGLSDGNYLYDLVPTIDGLGPSGGNAHCSQFAPAEGIEPEYVLPGSFVPKVTIIAMAMQQLASDS